MSDFSDFLKLSIGAPIDIVFENITFEVKQLKSRNKKTVLHGVSGKFLSGELTAIMGPSGAGKSSLLNILTGFRKTGVRGSVAKVLACRREAAAAGRLARYITQDDDLWPLFSVQEIMHLAANFKLGYRTSHKVRQILIDDVLKVIGLDHVKDTNTERLSGGQKKRLSIAQELLDNPQVIFLDEPTTGLDSSSTVQVVSVLKTLARGGRTIVCTIHQPCAKTLGMFDHVYVIAEGRCVYQGSSDNIVPYLGSLGLDCPQYHSPADFMLEVASGEHGDFIEELSKAAKESTWRQPYFRESGSDIDAEIFIHSESLRDKNILAWLNKKSEFSKFPIFLHRFFLQFHRDWTAVYLKCILHLLVGGVFSLFFRNVGFDGGRTFTNVLYLLSTVVYLSFTTAMPSALRFPSELSKLKKEKFNNWYYLRSYYISLMITCVPVQILLCVLHTSLPYFMTNQPMEWWRFVMFLLVCVLVTLLGESLGLFLGTVFNPVNGVFVGSVFLCFTILFAGCLILFSHMPFVFYCLSFLSMFRYAAIAMVLAIYDYDRDTLECRDETYCHLRHPKQLIKLYGVGEGEYWFNIAMLVTILVIFRVATYFALRYSIKSR
ncbi:ATP-binding cassette sub-family G member 1-like [Bacillus rossius redtenbacheri]|uniref:ATP-binding cassette sub-family G member 1-like n=1 Tax=Bacillus rossius redtenbacheri TaxID=93214 RepID=UPI002FDE53A9